MGMGNTRIALLGALAVTIDDAPVELGGTLPRALVARLALSAGQPVAPADLVAAMWPAPPEAAVVSLRAYVSRLRRGALGDRLHGGRGGYTLDVPTDAVDLLAARSLAQSDSTSRAALTRTLERLRAPVLQGLAAPVAAAVEREARAIERAMRDQLLLVASVGDAAGDAVGADAPSHRMPRRIAASRPSPLPIPLTAFVGRARELAALHATTGRVVTLTGVAGVGKSRLALEHAAHADRRAIFADVERNDIDSALGVALGMRTATRADYAAALAIEPSLLVLDGVDAVHAPFVRYLVERVPDLRVLATGRRPMGLAGERLVRIRPFETDDAAAVGMLVARASDAGVRLEAGDARMPAWLESASGIPRLIERLAIDLAHGRADARSAPPGTAGSADADSLGVDPCIAALDARLRTMLEAVVPFAGAVAAADVAHVLGERPDAVIAALSELARRSLLEFEADDDDVRFRLLPPVAARVGDGSSATRAAHRAWVLEHVVAHAGQRCWIEVERALETAVDDGDRDDAVRIGAALADRAVRRGDLVHATALLRRAIAVPGRAADTIEAKHEAAALTRLASIDAVFGAGPAAADAAIAAARTSGDAGALTDALTIAAAAHASVGQSARARTRLAEAARVVHGAGDVHAIAVRTVEGDLLAADGKPASALDAYAAALAIAKAHGLECSAERARIGAAAVFLGMRRAEDAAAPVAAVLATAAPVGDAFMLARALRMAAGVVAASDRLELAAKLLGCAESVRRRGGFATGITTPAEATVIARVREAMVPHAWRQALAAGRQWSVEQAVAAFGARRSRGTLDAALV